MKKFAQYFLIVMAVIAFQSCGDDGTSTNDNNTSTGKLTDSDKKLLYDKVWYPATAGTGLDHEFLNDGTFRLSQSLEGRWTWVNKSDTMDIQDAQNNRFKYIFQSATATSMSFKASSDGYKTVQSFSTTK
ncbi:MAG: hypothetical protein H6607_05700 [Flavobacteriales bacterium]|nr:hypothetical protein [Flavobacteriales bacterium]